MADKELIEIIEIAQQQITEETEEAGYVGVAANGNLVIIMLSKQSVAHLLTHVSTPGATKDADGNRHYGFMLGLVGMLAAQLNIHVEGGEGHDQVSQEN
jgi:hypothetical protein